jgi:ribosomal protein S1
VLEVDKSRKRISLSIKQATAPEPARPRERADRRTPEKTRREIADLPLDDALNALKNKFRK